MENFQINEENRLFILPPSEIAESEKLSEESMNFVKSTLAFEESSKLLVERLQSLARVVETQKLKALGQKSKLENIEEEKENKAKELQKIINDKKILSSSCLCLYWETRLALLFSLVLLV